MIRETIRYFHTLGIGGLIAAMKGIVTGSSTLFRVTRPQLKFPFYLRLPSSDLQTFRQIFIKHEYDFMPRKVPAVIIDAGANIGLASIYFSNKYPQAKIIAIEPELNNFLMLKENVKLYNNVFPVQAALWEENEEIELIDPGQGHWAFKTESIDKDGESSGKNHDKVQGITIDKIMEDYELDKIDILKIDIEGAELEVFKKSSPWINKVDALIVELHERCKPGCNRSFYNGSNGFDHEWVQGENVFLTKGEM